MSNRKTPPPDLGTPGDAWDRMFMLTLVGKIESFMREQKTPGQAVEGSMALINLPSNAGDLRTGDLWYDGNGFVKIVRSTDVFAHSFLVRIKVGEAVAA